MCKLQKPCRGFIIVSIFVDIGLQILVEDSQFKFSVNGVYLIFIKRINFKSISMFIHKKVNINSQKIDIACFIKFITCFFKF